MSTSTAPDDPTLPTLRFGSDAMCGALQATMMRIAARGQMGRSFGQAEYRAGLRRDRIAHSPSAL